MNNILILSIALVLAIFAYRITNKLNLPIVVGYVLLGVIFGKSMVGLFNQQFINDVDMLNDLALGAIAFTIGSELKKSVFQKLGKSIFFIVFFEAFSAFLLVSIGMYLMYPDKLYQALVLGAVASATAPAATVVVLNQYKAKGPLTSTILAVVGIDDAISLIIFSFSVSVAKVLIKGGTLSVAKILIHPVVEIIIAVTIGIIVAYLVNLFFRKLRSPDQVLIRVATAILLIIGLSKQFHFSELLAIMSFGSALVNLNPIFDNRALSTITTSIGPLFYAFFFILAGARLDIKLLPVVGLMGLVYTLLRAMGKFGGATLGAVLGKAPSVVRKYTGMGLIPQVGVAVALAILVDKMFGGGQYGAQGKMLSEIVINVLLFTTIITEIVGPLLTRYAITKAGERNN